LKLLHIKYNPFPAIQAHIIVVVQDHAAHIIDGMHQNVVVQKLHAVVSHKHHIAIDEVHAHTGELHAIINPQLSNKFFQVENLSLLKSM
jgi:hypothetical protein